MTVTTAYTDLRVLYLEDEPLIAYDTAEFLQELGFAEVKSASRLRTAESACDTCSFDLAILDINVGRNETSLSLGERLSKSGTSVIFASGNSLVASKLKEEGFEFLDKPFSYRDLEQAITAALDSQVSPA